MEFRNSLKNFIKEESLRLKKKFGKNKTQSERILARTAKLGEEYGELCNEVLAFLKDQRPEKLKGKKENDLTDEIADVIITTLLLADILNIDMETIESSLKRKIKKINKRKY